MNFNDFSKPTLIEPGVKFFLNQTLKQCHEFKNKYNNIIFNISLAVGFFLLLGTILLFKYKGKLTPAEKQRKNQEKQQYVLSKIRNYQQTKLRAQQSLITGLPQWDDEHTLLHRKV
jgi:hypothetical protein